MICTNCSKRKMDRRAVRFKNSPAGELLLNKEAEGTVGIQLDESIKVMPLDFVFSLKVPRPGLHITGRLLASPCWKIRLRLHLGGKTLTG